MRAGGPRAASEGFPAGLAAALAAAALRSKLVLTDRTQRADVGAWQLRVVQSAVC